ncbi:MAG: TIGR02452 family protein [Pirellulales bacterium]|nr:TIGR02452 family protein [Pirellulales bacterium]
MASRKQRAQIARNTLDIIRNGEYRLSDGTTVPIGEEVRQSVAGTRLYAPDDFAAVFEQRDQALAKASISDPTCFRVLNATTLAAARQLVSADGALDVLCLNFASAKNPGGGFLNGSQAQEESLARASALYACISPEEQYYDTNRACGTCLYTDHMIYSPLVPVFRNDVDELLASPYCVSMLTAPAVNAGAVCRNEPENAPKISEVMIDRIEKVLSLAVVHGHKALVLGAWGCGVFRNDPASVAHWFGQHLGHAGTFNHFFDTVVFAVLDTTEDHKFIGPFQQQFSNSLTQQARA